VHTFLPGGVLSENTNGAAVTLANNIVISRNHKNNKVSELVSSIQSGKKDTKAFFDDMKCNSKQRLLMAAENDWQQMLEKLYPSNWDELMTLSAKSFLEQSSGDRRAQLLYHKWIRMEELQHEVNVLKGNASAVASAIGSAVGSAVAVSFNPSVKIIPMNETTESAVLQNDGVNNDVGADSVVNVPQGRNDDFLEDGYLGSFEV
jgi:hypothetical protein